MWPKATARERVREGDVPPLARSAKLKLPPFYKVNAWEAKKRSIACCVALSMEKKFRSGGQLPPCPPPLNTALASELGILNWEVSGSLIFFSMTVGPDWGARF